MTAGLLIVMVALSGGAPAGAAPADGAASGPTDEVRFGETPGALRGISLTVLLRAREDLGAMESALAAVTAAGGRATVIVPSALAEREGARLKAAADAGHEVALWLNPPADANRGMEGVDAWKASTRAQLKTVRKATGKRPKTVLVPVLPRTGEVALDALRVRTVLLDRPDRPRRIVDLSGIPGGLVFPVPQVEAVSAASLDTVARAMSEASEGGFPTIGLSVSLDSLDEDGAALLQRWMTEVIAPTGARALTARSIPLRATASTEAAGASPTVARPVDLADLQAAAAELAGVTRMPRALQAGINPTEAFLAFCLLLEQDVAPDRVLLGALSPPAEEARSALTAGATMDAAAIRAAAGRMAPYLTRQVPNLVDAGGTTLTASEFLLAMARVINGDDPVALTTPMNPDPYTAGLGWGASTGR